MKPKTVVLMLVAVACGLTAAILATLYSPSPEQRSILLLVAADPLKAGTVIDEKMLIPRPYLPDTVPEGAVRDFDEVRGKVLARALDRNMPVTRKDLNLNERLLEDVPPGTRALTIRVNIESAHAGFTLPGSHVDLLCTLADPNDGRRTLTRTFLQRVLVLAVNTQQQPAQGQAVIPSPATVTLAVGLEEAERITWAKERGNISMVLRKPGDRDVLKTRGAVNPFFSGEPEDNKVRYVKVLVARKNISPDTLIDDTATYFDAVNYPEDTVRNAVLETEKETLRNRTVFWHVPEGSPITTRHFEPIRKERPTGDVVTWLRVQVSDQPPHDYKFVNGRSAGRSSHDAANPDPMPEK